MDISILIPCYNEAAIIKGTYLKIKEEIQKFTANYEIIFVNDGSSDDTEKILKDIAEKDKKIKLFSYSVHRGLGYAYQRLYKMATGEIVIQMDADLSTPVSIFHKFIEEIKNADVVVASKYIGQISNFPFHRFLFSRIYYMLNKLLFGLDIKDIASGFVSFRKKVLDSIELQSEGWEIHLELFAKIKARGFKVEEIPAKYEHRHRGSKLNIFKDGPITLSRTFKIWRRSKKRGFYS